MTRKLNDADRAAVDLLFDRITSTSDANGGNGGNGGDGVVAMSSAVADANIQAVEKVLDLLAHMPAHEPPADLATRTLARINEAAESTLPTMPGAFTGDQPHA